MVEDLSTSATDALPTSIVTAIIIISFVELILKAFALWRAARKNNKGWYVAMLLINSAGLLPLVYLLFIGKKDDAYKS